MKILRQISDDEMIAVFLKAEIFSPRFSQFILPLLKRYGVNKEVLINPDILNSVQNNLRRKILGNYRGYQQYSLLFKDFPDNVSWFRALISKNQLGKIRYIHDKYWNKLSNHSRYAVVGAENIRQDKSFFNVPNNGYWAVSQALAQGKKFEEVILVGTDVEDELVILEGHERLTGFLLKPELLPDELEVITGLSQDMRFWAGYGPSVKKSRKSSIPIFPQTA